MRIFVMAIFILAGSALSRAQDLPQQLPPEYDNMQGVIVAWLPFGQIPDRPITQLSDEERTLINEQSMSEKHGNGHKWKPKFNQIMAERIKLKKGDGSPDTVGLGIDTYPYHYMMLDLVKAIIDSGAVAHIVTDGETIRHQLINFMLSCGFKQHDLNKIVFHYFWLNSIWMRDYGPWVTEANNRLAVLDSKYFPSRPADNLFPEFFSRIYGLPKTDFDQFYTEGGNILTDNQGRGFTTQAILLSNPGMDIDTVTALFKNAINLDELVFLPGSFPDDIDEALAALGGTGHVDMGLKLLSDTKVMIGDFAAGSAGKALLDSWAEWFETHTNPRGEPYEVYRVTGATNGFEPFSYINSVIVNKTVIVPQFGQAEADAAAIEAYREALPAYKTIGVRSEMLPPWSGGLHCITKEIPIGVFKAVDSDEAWGGGADEQDRENHDDLVWVNDVIGEAALYASYPDVSATAPAVMAATLGLPVGKENPDNFIVPWPDYMNYDYMNPYNNIPLQYPSFGLLQYKFANDWILRNRILFPIEPKSAIEQAVYVNPDILVVSVGTADLAAWNYWANTAPEVFAGVVDSLLTDHLGQLQRAEPGKKIVLTTPFDYGAILVAIARYYGLELSPQDIEEDEYATLYADIIHQKVGEANAQGLNFAVADFTALHKRVASPGTEKQGIPLNLATLDLLIDPVTGHLTDFFGAVHASVVIEAINSHYGESYPLPDLTQYLPTTMYSSEGVDERIDERTNFR
jgi:agmatine deiminase